MHLYRPLARLVALTFAVAAFAACGGDSTSPLDLEPEEFEMLGETVALEIEGSVVQLTADGASMGTDVPAFAMGSPISERLLGPAARNVVPMRQPMRQLVDQECGQPSQEVPTDSDGDGVPDNLHITFALPACHIVTEDFTMDLTGVFRISDPTPGTAGMALAFGLDNFRVGMANQEFSGSVVRDGDGAVSVSETGLSQSQDWRETIRFDGFPAISAAIDWTAAFAVAQGQSFVPGEPLPDGTYTPNGTFVYREGNRQSAFSVTTLESLEYSAECAAGVAEGLADTPFMGGVLRIAFAGQEGRGFVQVSYDACSFATAQFVAVN